MDTNVAYCCTLHNEQDVIYWQLKYYYLVGVRDFFIQFNTATDLTRVFVRQFADEHKDVNVHTFVNDDRSYEKFPERKMLMYTKALEMGFDWVLPLDADELITPKNRRLRKNFNIVEYLNSTFPNAKPNEYTKFPGYNFIATQDDDWFNANPFERMEHRRTVMYFGKVVWRCGKQSSIFRGAHNVVNGTKNLKTDNHLITAHYPFRSPTQVSSKRICFAQCASHTYDDIPKSLPDMSYYDKAKGGIVGNNAKKSRMHQKGKLKDGLSILQNPMLASELLRKESNEKLVKENVWRDTFESNN